MNKEQFFTSIQGKTVTFCGIGRSHMPLIRLFQEKGALVSARDKRSLEELGDCVSGAATPEEALDLAELGRAIGDYLRTLPLPARRAFLCRYYYADSLAETARVCGISVPAVKSQLYRTRQGLRTYLEKEGFDI